MILLTGSHFLESISEHLERPLCSISGEELGSGDAEVQWRLHDFFSRAERWNAIALLEEADVVFGMRSSADPETGRGAVAEGEFIF